MLPKNEQEDLSKEIKGAVFCGCGEQKNVFEEGESLCPACDANECICNSFAQILAGGKEKMPCPIHDHIPDIRKKV